VVVTEEVAEMTRTAKQFQEELAVLESAVLAADAAWAEDLSNKTLAGVYKAAKAAFRAVEREYLAKFPELLEPCRRCGGAGGWSGWPGFTCYECGGRCKMSYPTRKRTFQASPATREKRRLEYEARLAEEAATFERALAELDPDVARALVEARDRVEGYERCEHDEDGRAVDRYRGEPPSREVYFRASLAGKLARFGSLSTAQVDAVKRGLERETRDAARPELGFGRRELEGEIVSIKSQQSRFGSQTKMLVVLADGNRVYGTYPTALYGDYNDPDHVREGAREGDVVRLTATVEQSADDVHFGFFSNPAKAEIVAQKIEAHRRGEEGRR
jgi:hypothetical protein